MGTWQKGRKSPLIYFIEQKIGQKLLKLKLF